MMHREPDFEALERALVDLGAHISYPPEPDLAARVGIRLEGRRRRFARGAAAHPRLRARVQAGLVVAVLVALVLMVSPTARTAVAGLLRLPGIRIIFGPPPSPAPRTPSAPAGPSPTGLGLGVRTTLSGAAAAVPFHVLVPAKQGLTDPQVFLSPLPEGNAVQLAYPPQADLPAAAGTNLGLLVTEFRGTLEPAYFGKFIGPGTRLEALTVNGRPGFWIEGAPHELLYLAPDGSVQTSTTRLAGNTLLWEQGGVTIRVEGSLSKAEGLEIAASMH